jgi:hypothetical protein
MNRIPIIFYHGCSQNNLISGYYQVRYFGKISGMPEINLIDVFVKNRQVYS